MCLEKQKVQDLLKLDFTEKDIQKRILILASH